MKEAVVTAPFMFELNIVQILHQEMTYFLTFICSTKWTSVILCYSFSEKTQKYHLGSMGLFLSSICSSESA